MKEIITQIMQRHGLLEAFSDPARHRHVHLRLTQPKNVYMPLVIERLYTDDHGCQVVSVCHYTQMNGDPMRDPEMCFDFRDWRPLYLRNDFIGVEEYVFTSPERKQYYPRLARELRSFAATWARNLLAQGWLEPDVSAESLSHPQLLKAAP
jgi:hypothetical protein